MNCCSKRCANSFNVKVLETEFQKFWDFGDYDKQNNYIFSLMSIKNTVLSSKWDYIFRYNGNILKVCQKFLLSLYQISKSRLRVIQMKIKNGMNLTLLYI